MMSKPLNIAKRYRFFLMLKVVFAFVVLTFNGRLYGDHCNLQNEFPSAITSYCSTHNTAELNGFIGYCSLLSCAAWVEFQPIFTTIFVLLSLLMNVECVQGLSASNDQSDAYEWSDQSPNIYTNWLNGDWQQDQSRTSSRRCVELASAEGYHWRVENCSSEQPYICEYRK